MMTTVLLKAVLYQKNRKRFRSRVYDDAWNTFIIIVTEDALIRMIYSENREKLLVSSKDRESSIFYLVEERFKKIKRMAGTVSVTLILKDNRSWWEMNLSNQLTNTNVTNNNAHLTKDFQQITQGHQHRRYMSKVPKEYVGTTSIHTLIKRHVSGNSSDTSDTSGINIIALCSNEAELISLMWEEYEMNSSSTMISDILIIDDLGQKVGSSLRMVRKAALITTVSPEKIVWENLLTLLPLVVNVGLPTLLFGEKIRDRDILFSLSKLVDTLDDRIIDGTTLSLNVLEKFLRTVSRIEKDTVMISQKSKSNGSSSEKNLYVSGKDWNGFKIRFYKGNYLMVQDMVIRRCRTYIEALIYFHLLFRYELGESLIKKLGSDLFEDIATFRVSINETVLTEDLLTYVRQLMFNYYSVIEKMDDTRDYIRDPAVLKFSKVVFNNGRYMKNITEDDNRKLEDLRKLYGSVRVKFSKSIGGRSVEEAMDPVQACGLGRLIPYHPGRYE